MGPSNQAEMPLFPLERVKGLGDPWLEQAKLEGHPSVERFDEHRFELLPERETDQPVARAEVYGHELQEAPDFTHWRMSGH